MSSVNTNTRTLGPAYNEFGYYEHLYTEFCLQRVRLIRTPGYCEEITSHRFKLPVVSGTSCTVSVPTTVKVTLTDRRGSVEQSVTIDTMLNFDGHREATCIQTLIVGCVPSAAVAVSRGVPRGVSAQGYLPWEGEGVCLGVSA